MLFRRKMMNHLSHPGPAVKKIESFLQSLITTGGLNVKFKIVTGSDQVQPSASEFAATPSSAAVTAEPLLPIPTPEITVEFTGPDAPLLTARRGELLLAIEHIAAKIIRLESEEHDRISFDAENFKILRQQELRLAAEVAIERVRRSGQPYSFSPMSSRERRLLHLALANSGLQSASSGAGPGRFVVLYPEGYKPTPTSSASSDSASSEERTRAIRNTFRRR